ncbi:MAG: transporter [Anaerolineaceae bacterium]|nr:transporter [Anaerolineaceae bacterium]
MGVMPRTQTTETTRPIKHLNKRVLTNWLSFFVFSGPALIVFAIFMLYPLANMFHVSTLDWEGLIKPSVNIGLANYEKLFTHDRHFSTALLNTAIQIAIALPGTIFPAFILGFFLSLRWPGYRILRTVYFSPVMLAAPGVSMLFLGLYLPDGIINFLLRQFGLESLTHVWLADVNTSLLAVTAVEIWAGIGFYTVLFFGVLSNIPREIYEAALMEGANLWEILWKIVFPMTLDFFGVVLMLHYMWLLLGAAQNVLLLTQGGPGDSSLTLGFYLYKQAFQIRDLGYSQAIGVFIFFVGLAGMLVIRLATHRKY